MFELVYSGWTVVRTRELQMNFCFIAGDFRNLGKRRTIPGSFNVSLKSEVKVILNISSSLADEFHTSNLVEPDRMETETIYKQLPPNEISSLFSKKKIQK